MVTSFFVADSPFMLTFDKSWNTLRLVECRGEADEETTDGFAAGDARPSGAENASGRAYSRLGHRAEDTASLARRVEGGPGVSLPGAPSVGGAGLDHLGLGSFGQ